MHLMHTVVKHTCVYKRMQFMTDEITVGITVGMDGESPVLNQAQFACSTCQTLLFHLSAEQAVVSMKYVHSIQSQPSQKE
jgi:hypothetical protein